MTSAPKKNPLKKSGKSSLYYDPITKLPNNSLFYDRVSQSIKLASRIDSIIAVLFIRVDRLKVINDKLGKNVGNQLLRALVKRIRECVRKSDTIARPGRDELTILLPEIRNPEDTAVVIRKIFRLLENPFVIKKHDLLITLSIGISIYPSDGITAESLLRSAYTAMQRSKEDRKNTYHFFTQALTEKAFDRMVMENSIHLAFQRGEFILHYQPQIDLTTGKIIGVEALVRWQRPGFGLVYPKEFLPLLDEIGLTVTLGEWALRTACEQHIQWSKSGLKNIRMAVNISAHHFHEHDIVHSISKILEETGMKPEFLEIELTESIFIKNVERTVKALKVLRRMGINISIDDFGTGYSSLGYLKYLPMNKLKIVEPFISSVSVNSKEEVIIRAVIALAHSLNMKVIAEGVESKDQLAYIRTLNCDELQGNILSNPLPAEDVAQLFSQKKIIRQRLAF